MKFRHFYLRNMLFLVLFPIIVGSGCHWFGPGESGPPPTTGSLFITIGFGAGIPNSTASCTGGGTVTLTSPGGVTQSKAYSYSGFVSDTSPGCSVTIGFSNLQPGIWTIQESTSGVICRKQIAAGQLTTAMIRTDTGQCQ